MKVSSIYKNQRTFTLRCTLIPELREGATPPSVVAHELPASQRILELRDDGSMVFELNIIINRELVRLLFGFAEGIKVLTPRKLVYMMRTHFEKGAELYKERV